MMSDSEKWQLSELKALVESTNDGGAVRETLTNIVQLLDQEQSANFILGKVIVENDMLDDDNDEDADDD